MHGTWAARLLGLDGNELRRRVDRARVWGTVAAVLVVLIGAPILARPVMGMVHDSAARTAYAQAQHRHRVVAVLPQGASPSASMAMMGNPTVRVPARWRAPDGSLRRGTVPMADDVRPGGTAPVWVDDRGDPATKPLTASQVRGQTVMGGIGAGFGLLTLVGFPLLVFRRRLDHRAYERWEIEWAIMEPRWTRRK